MSGVLNDKATAFKILLVKKSDEKTKYFLLPYPVCGREVPNEAITKPYIFKNSSQISSLVSFNFSKKTLNLISLNSWTL